MSDELRARVETLDAVPEPLRPFYKPSDKGFVLHLPDAEDVYAAGLKKNRDELLAQAAKEKESRKAFDGIDPEKARTALAAQAKAEEEKARQEGNYTAMLAAKEKAYADKETEWAARSTKLQSALDDALVTSELQNAIIALEGIPKALTPHLRGQIKVLEEDGKYVARVVDPKGNVRYAGAAGDPMPIKALVEEARKDPELAFAFKGTGSSGGGAPSGGRAPTTSPTVVGRDAFLANIDAIAKGTVTVK